VSGRRGSNPRPRAWEANSESVQPFAWARKLSDSFGNEGYQRSTASQPIAGFRRDFVPRLSPNLRAIQGRATDLITVREVASRLSVSTATVYKLCDRGELPHVRVSNAIRFAPVDLAGFIARSRSSSDQCDH